MLVVALTAACFSAPTQKAFAEEENPDSVQVTISGDNTLSLTPGQFGTIAQRINVSTTNAFGYKLTLKTADQSTSMVNTSDSSLYIPTLSEEKTATDFASEWGYSLDGTHFKGIPELASDGDLIGSTNSANATGTSDLYNIDFGMGVGADVAAGTYQNTVTFIAVAKSRTGGILYYV